ncbi:MAG: serine/threonine protein kinase [Flavobacteriales bacterium]|jgi:serine/threonine protein kinase
MADKQKPTLIRNSSKDSAINEPKAQADYDDATQLAEPSFPPIEHDIGEDDSTRIIDTDYSDNTTAINDTTDKTQLPDAGSTGSSDTTSASNSANTDTSNADTSNTNSSNTTGSVATDANANAGSYGTDSTRSSGFHSNSTMAGTQAENSKLGSPNQTTLLKKKRKADDGNLQIGSIIKDRFVMEKVLGAGGMGAVYKALDLRKQEAGDHEPYIAIKLLKGNFQFHSDAFVTLQREAKKTQVLAHPNIVTVYDFDRDDDLIYLTMEELKGHALNDLLKSNAPRVLTQKERISIIEQLANGLSYAHSKGIVHSDLKPANIFVTDKNEVKILDFGIARAANEELYQDNFDAGKLGALTFAYASLEMIQFDPPHPSDDIYALGIIACELLDGTHPFKRKDARQVQHLKLAPKKLSIKNPFVRKTILHAIKLKRADRIQDAKQFQKRLRSARATPKRLALGAVILTAALSVNALYIQTIETDIIPFKSLTIEQQTQFHALIKEGNTALKFKDMQGAVVYFNDAYLIHKSHKDIVKATGDVIGILEGALKNAAEGDKPFIKGQIEALSEYAAFGGSQGSEGNK